MLTEAQLFDESERYVIDRSIIDAVALPLGDRYEDDIFEQYFGDYCGYARKFKPKRIFEIGVRYGYTAIAMACALKAMRGSPKVEYVGIDDESYHFGSCAQANRNFEQAVPDRNLRAIKWNSFNGLPPGIGTFQLIHVDGNHTYQGVWNDLRHVWPLLEPGGVVVIDDARSTDDHGAPAGIYTAAMEFLSQFEHTAEAVEWQYVVNQRCHLLARQCA